MRWVLLLLAIGVAVAVWAMLRAEKTHGPIASAPVVAIGDQLDIRVKESLAVRLLAVHDELKQAEAMAPDEIPAARDAVTHYDALVHDLHEARPQLEDMMGKPGVERWLESVFWPESGEVAERLRARISAAPAP